MAGKGKGFGPMHGMMKPGMPSSFSGKGGSPMDFGKGIATGKPHW